MPIILPALTARLTFTADSNRLSMSLYLSKKMTHVALKSVERRAGYYERPINITPNSLQLQFPADTAVFGRRTAAVICAVYLAFAVFPFCGAAFRRNLDRSRWFSDFTVVKEQRTKKRQPSV